jgi:hypothetical protein
VPCPAEPDELREKRWNGLGRACQVRAACAFQDFPFSVHTAPWRPEGRAPSMRSRRTVPRRPPPSPAGPCRPVPEASIRLSSPRWETGVPSIRCRRSVHIRDFPLQVSRAFLAYIEKQLKNLRGFLN